MIRGSGDDPFDIEGTLQVQRRMRHDMASVDNVRVRSFHGLFLISILNRPTDVRPLRIRDPHLPGLQQHLPELQIDRFSQVRRKLNRSGDELVHRLPGKLLP